MYITSGVLVFLAVLFGTIYPSTCVSFQISKDNFDKKLVGHSVGEVKDINHHECARQCMSLTICKSIDYDGTGSTCKMNDVDKSSADTLEFETKKGSIFSNINDWPSVMVKGCSTRPCQQNQRCYVHGDSHVCRDITCVIGKQIDYGTIEINAPGQNKFLDMALVNCNTGFVASQEEVKCQANGEWQQATCEMQNVAVGKETAMSSIYHEMFAERAVDGNTSQYSSDNSCFHTLNTHQHPWWQVDLGMIYDVFKVVLYNRLDPTIARRTHNLDLLAGTTLENLAVIAHVPGQIDDIHTFDFPAGVQARYVNVTLYGYSMLHLCEVQVFGYPL